MASVSSSPSDLDLLDLWFRVNANANTNTQPGGVLQVAVSRQGWLVMDRGDSSGDLVTALQSALVSEPHDVDNPQPSGLDRCIALAQNSLGTLRVEGGPVYVIAPAPLLALTPVPPSLRIVTSHDAAREPVAVDRPRNWEPEEWMHLLRGDLGPWAIALAGRRVVSVCHTPRTVTPKAAECGVWTDPEYRGQRTAEAVIAAWSRLFDASGRTLFYSTDTANISSQRLAARLGLQLIGRGWTLAAGDWPEGDAWGRALLDYHRGVWVPMPELETDFGEVGPAMHPEWFFREFDRWDWWDRELLPLIDQGPVLDLGAGAGRAALWLQGNGLEVTAIDSSPGAVQVCHDRGIRDSRLGDVNMPPDDKSWKAMLLLCGNLGLGGSWEGIRSLLTRLANIAAPDAVLIGDTVEPHGPADIGLRIRYKGVATPWWRQRNVPVSEIPALIEGTGWAIDRHVVDNSDHAVVLRRT